MLLAALLQIPLAGWVVRRGTGVVLPLGALLLGWGFGLTALAGGSAPGRTAGSIWLYALSVSVWTLGAIVYTPAGAAAGRPRGDGHCGRLQFPGPETASGVTHLGSSTDGTTGHGSMTGRSRRTGPGCRHSGQALPVWSAPAPQCARASLRSRHGRGQDQASVLRLDCEAAFDGVPGIACGNQPQRPEVTERGHRTLRRRRTQHP